MADQHELQQFGTHTVHGSHSTVHGTHSTQHANHAYCCCYSLAHRWGRAKLIGVSCRRSSVSLADWSSSSLAYRCVCGYLCVCVC